MPSSWNPYTQRRGQVSKTDLALSAAQGGRRDPRDSPFSLNMETAALLHHPPQAEGFEHYLSTSHLVLTPKGSQWRSTGLLCTERNRVLSPFQNNTAGWGHTPKKELSLPASNPGHQPITGFLPSEESCSSWEHGQHQLAELTTAGTFSSHPSRKG